MTNERYTDLPEEIKQAFERQDKIKELEKTDPLVSQLSQIRDIVRKDENKRGEHAYVIDRREKDSTGFYFYSDYHHNISIAEGSYIKREDGNNRIKNKVVYSDGHLSLDVDHTIVDDQVTALFEEPGESVLMPNEKYKFKVKGQWRDTITVEGPIDSMGESTLRYTKKIVARALIELTY